MPQRVLRQPHRDHYQTIKQILQNIYSKAGGCRATEVAYRSELTWKRFREYQDPLTSRRLLIPSDNEATQHYEITPNGIRFLELFAEIEDGLRPEETASNF
jgi:predicted transcriptional regulator